MWNNLNEAWNVMSPIKIFAWYQEYSEQYRVLWTQNTMLLLKCVVELIILWLQGGSPESGNCLSQKKLILRNLPTGQTKVVNVNVSCFISWCPCNYIVYKPNNYQQSFRGHLSKIGKYCFTDENPWPLWRSGVWMQKWRWLEKEMKERGEWR